MYIVEYPSILGSNQGLEIDKTENTNIWAKGQSIMFHLVADVYVIHTIYPGNNMCQKCGRKSGLWVLHEIVNKTYAENMKKIVGAVWELPAKQHSQFSPI